MLTGQIKSFDDLPYGDFRRMLPRFQPDVFDNNMKLVERLDVIAKNKGCTSAQLALNWILSITKKPGMPKIIPITGATTEERVKENAVEVQPTEEELLMKFWRLVKSRATDTTHGMKLANTKLTFLDR
jgi:pyridoxine 4-dehydrogenase